MIRYICDVNAQEIEHINKSISFIHDETFDEEYQYSGNFAICKNVEDWERECSPCCGTSVQEIELPTGRKVFFCFDYGH
jgi:hypothetical protein